jgi:ribose-phosphate pyrophosphokinase
VAQTAALGDELAGANAVLAQCPLERLLVTDTIASERITDPGVRSRLVTLGTADLFAEAIARMHAGGSIVELVGS